MRNMMRHVLSLICLVLLALSPSCGSKVAAPPPAKPPSILDKVLQSEQAQKLMKAAEQELPTDQWKAGGESRPGRHNVSRFRRERDVATQLLAIVYPQLKEMSARELLESLKTFPYGEYGTFPGVAYYVYLDGNQMIMNHLEARPARELQSLGGYRLDQSSVFTGDNGAPVDVGGFVRYSLLREPL
jgi:hypothetical protein